MKLQDFLNSRPRQSARRALQQFLIEKQSVTSAKNTVHLFESLYALICTLPVLETITYNDLSRESQKLWLRYGAGSIRSKLTDWRTFFRWCHRQGLITQDITKHLKLPRQPRPRNKSASETDVLQVINDLAQQLSGHIQRNVFGPLEIVPNARWLPRSHVHTLRDLLLLVLLYESGARAGEIANLSSRQMREAVASPIQLQGGEQIYKLKVFGKSGERERIFTQTTAELWEIWAQVRPRAGSEYAFTRWSKKGEAPRPLSADYVSKILVRKCKIVGVNNFRSHAIRHAKAHRAKKHGGLEVALAILDHDDIRSTLFYTGEDEHDLHAAALATGLQLKLF